MKQICKYAKRVNKYLLEFLVLEKGKKIIERGCDLGVWTKLGRQAILSAHKFGTKRRAAEKQPAISTLLALLTNRVICVFTYNIYMCIHIPFFFNILFFIGTILYV